MKNTLAVIEDFIWDNRQFLPYTAMGITALALLPTGSSLFASTAFIGGAGVATLSFIKIGDLYVSIKNALKNISHITKKVNDETLKSIDSVLKQVNTKTLKDVDSVLKQVNQGIVPDIKGIADRLNLFFGEPQAKKKRVKDLSRASFTTIGTKRNEENETSEENTKTINKPTLMFINPSKIARKKFVSNEPGSISPVFKKPRTKLTTLPK